MSYSADIIITYQGSPITDEIAKQNPLILDKYPKKESIPSISAALKIRAIERKENQRLEITENYTRLNGVDVTISEIGKF